MRWSSICRPRYQEKGGHYSPDKDCDEPKQIALTQGGVVEKCIQEDRQTGIHSSVNGTPTFYINGKRYDGSHDYDSLLAALESLALRSV